MKKTIVSLFLFLCGTISDNSAQTIKQTIDNAGSYLQSEKPDSAHRLYRRAVYFLPPEEKSLVCFKAAVEFERIKQYNYALIYLDSAQRHVQKSNSHLKEKDIELLRIKILLMQHKNYEVLELFEKHSDTLQAETDSISGFYKGVALLETGQYDAAYASFFGLLGDAEIHKSEKLTALFSDTKKYQKPDAHTAAVLSTLLPGSGQLYAGESRQAVSAFFLNAGLFFLLFDLSINHGGYSALLSVYPWFERYQRGTALNAGQLALKQQKNKRQKLLSEILDLFLDTDRD